MRFLISIVVMTILGSLGCSQLRRSRQEDGLRKALCVLRSEIAQFTADKQRGPTSLSDLVASGYLREIPTDPITGKNDTWVIESSGDLEEMQTPPNIVNVHSGSHNLGSDGRPYILW